MSLFSDQSATFRTEFPDGAWVEMRCEITYGDRKCASDAATGRFQASQESRAQGRQKGDGVVSVEAPFSQPTYIVALLKRMIIAWSEADPVTQTNIERLPDQVVDELMEELNARNESRSEQDADPLEPSSIPSSGTPIEESAIAGQVS